MKKILRSLVYVIGVVLTLWTLYFSWALPMDRTRHSVIFLGGGIALFYLVQVDKNLYDTDDSIVRLSESYFETWTSLQLPFPDFRSSLPNYDVLDSIVCLALTGATVASAAYFYQHFDRLAFDAHVLGYTNADALVGTILLVIVTDATRRAFGNAISLVVIASVLYGLFGSYLPGIFQHGGMSWSRMIQYAALDLNGIFGFILGVGTTWVAIFIMFAGIAKAYGLMDLVISIGQEMQKSLRSGPIHIAIISSIAMGSITGSAAANTATTGSFTIPIMKDQGVDRDYAAAIESVASAGGQMLPPVMGVAAFLMADILGLPYVDIISAGLLPALLFYFCVFISVHLAVIKFGWTSDNSGSFDRRVLRRLIYYAIPLLILIYTLVIVRMTPLSAGLYTILSMIPIMYTRDIINDGLTVGTIAGTTKETVDGFREGAVEMAPLVGVLASLGVIVAMVSQTGLSAKISTRMVALAGGVFLFVLILAMFTSILFGLGMPTPAAYILVVILAAPALIDLGIRELSAHMFVFYFAMLSAITPPVALSVAVGSRIADSDFITSCVQALRIGLAGFIVPFIFVIHQSLIYWEYPTTLITLGIILVGLLGIGFTAIGHDGTQALARKTRVAYLVLAFMIFFGPFAAQLLGILVLAGLRIQLTARYPTILVSDTGKELGGN